MNRNLYIRTVISPSSKVSSQANRRQNKIERIKISLQKIPMIKRNISLNKRRIALENPSSPSLEENPDETQSPYDGAPIAGTLQTFESQYQLLEKLGEGSSGLVRKCRQKATGDLFAVKSFSFEDEQLPGLRANFLLMKRLRHNNVLKYQQLYIDLKKRMGWLVMELVIAPSLEKVELKSEEDLKMVIYQLLDALNYLHQHHIVHRDIKGSNILIDPETKVIKVVDFGLAKRVKKRGALVDMWTITGTLYYRAPQILEGGGYREAVDIWAIGILLYKLIAGYTPFQSPYHHQTIHQIRNGWLVFPQIFDNYSQNIKSFISKLLERDAELRPLACECLKQSWISGLYLSIGQQRRKEKYRKVSVNLINKVCPCCKGDGIKSRMPQKWSLNDFKTHEGHFQSIEKIKNEMDHIHGCEFK